MTISQEGMVVQQAVPLSFEQLYAEHVAGVYRFCLSQVGYAAAEDVTHDTFLRAHAAYARIRWDRDAPRLWLLAIARNLSVDHHRRRGRWLRLLARQDAETTLAVGDVESIAEDWSRLRQVHQVLKDMHRRDRELIGLRVAADLSFRDVGEVLGLSEAAAKVATRRALTRLRQALAAGSTEKEARL